MVNGLKILHIFCAALLLSNLFYSYYLWKTAVLGQKQLGITFMLAMLQLVTGLMMIHLGVIDIHVFWVKASVFAFGVWFCSNLLFVLWSASRAMQTGFFGLSGVAFLSMIFLMSNKPL